MPRRCPPGTFCFSESFLAVSLLVTIVAVAAYSLGSGRPVGGGLGLRAAGPQSPPAYFGPAGPAAAPPQPPIHIEVTGGGDDRYTRAPKPERDWLARPDLSAVWNAPTVGLTRGGLPTVATRGIPESYQSMGVITLDNGDSLPLYGRRTGSRSDRFQYYTRTDTYNPVQLPLSHKRRNCQDDVGCEELMDGDEVKIPTNGKTGKVNVYRFSGPTYVPIVM